LFFVQVLIQKKHEYSSKHNALLKSSHVKKKEERRKKRERRKKEERKKREKVEIDRFRKFVVLLIGDLAKVTSKNNNHPKVCVKNEE